MGSNQLSGRRVAFLATDGVQEEELSRPWEAIRSAGGVPELISLKTGEIRSTVHGEPGRSFRVDRTIGSASVRDYDALVLPGGVKNPDTLRQDERAVAFVRGFMAEDRPVAAICHAPWLLIEADAVRGRLLTSYPSLRTDIRNAGGEWVDRAVAVDQRLVTSRTPADLDQFCATMVEILSRAIAERSLDQVVEQSFPASDPPPGPGAL